jgi:hypothetical protein
MMPHRFRLSLTTLWFGCGIGFAVLGTVLALVPHPPKIVPEFSWLDWLREANQHLAVLLAGDKLDHVVGFGSLMIWFCQVFTTARDRIRVAVALLVHAAVIELLQSFTTWRSAELGDWIAGGVGIGIGWLASCPRTPCILPWLRSMASRRAMSS